MVFVEIFIMLWAIITTFYGLYLSWKNNQIYNKQIVELLERLNHSNNTIADLLKQMEEKENAPDQL